MKKLFICIPTYNEALNIIKIIKQLEDVSQKISDYEVNVVVIDDNSPDGTAKLVEEYKTKSKIKLHVVNNPNKVGLGKAYIKGFKYSLENGADAICQMDADFSHDPKYLIPITRSLKDYDFVMGSRYIKGGGTVNWNFKRRFISRYGNLYSRLILAAGIHDLTGGYNCWNRKVLESINLDSIKANGFFFQIELKYKAIKKGFKWLEIPIIFKDRELGQSKFGSSIFKEALIKPWQLRIRN